MSGFLGIFSISSQIMMSPAQRILGNSVFSYLTIPPQYMDCSSIHLSLMLGGGAIPRNNAYNQS